MRDRIASELRDRFYDCNVDGAANAIAELVKAEIAEAETCITEAGKDRREIARLSAEVGCLRDGLMEVVALADRHRTGNNAAKLIADVARATLQGRR